jgi:SAM-dependent methyltransferase
VDRPHPRWARFYERVAASAERKGASRFRSELVSGLAGKVIEVGCGPGLNFAHYPPEATRVQAVEPEPYLRGAARERARAASVEVDVMPGRAESLPFPDGHFDGAVVCYLLCTVDAAPVLGELHRVVRPGGALRFWEHVRSRRRSLTAIQEAVDLLFWPRLGAGCHTARDSVSSISDAGFEIVAAREFWFSPQWFAFPAGPQVLGAARR